MRCCWPCISLNLRKMVIFYFANMTKSASLAGVKIFQGTKMYLTPLCNTSNSILLTPPHLFQLPSTAFRRMIFLWSFLLFMFSGCSLLLECSFSLPSTNPHFDQLSWFTLSLPSSSRFSLEYSNTAVPNQCCEILLVEGSCLQWASGFCISHWMFPDMKALTAFWVFPF